MERTFGNASILPIDNQSMYASGCECMLTESADHLCGVDALLVWKNLESDLMATEPRLRNRSGRKFEELL